jgi:sRNA-binding protein
MTFLVLADSSGGCQQFLSCSPYLSTMKQDDSTFVDIQAVGSNKKLITKYATRRTRARESERERERERERARERESKRERERERESERARERNRERERERERERKPTNAYPR